MTVSYKLDTAGNRLQVLEDGVVTKRYVYAPESTSPVAEVDASGNTTTRYAYAPGSNVPAYMTRAGATYRFITDQLGSVRRVVNTSTGAVAQSIDYDPYGKITQDSNENFQPFGFASGLYDSQTGLTHFGAREYDPSLGRWTSSDPIGFGGGDPNLYGYVLGDPVNWVDPEGLSPIVLPIPDLRKHCGKSYADRVADNFVTTNRAIPGIAAPILSGVVTAGSMANKLRTVTPLKYVWQLATRAPTRPPIGPVAISSLANAAAVAAAFETGVAIGSLIRGAYASCDCQESS